MADKEFDVRSNLGPVIADMKAISPKLARGFRAAVRASGEAIIQEAKAALEEPTIGGVVTKTTYTAAAPNRPGGVRTGPRARMRAGARIAALETESAKRSRNRGSREAVAAGLRTRVSVSKTRGASVRVSTTTPGYLDVAFNTKKWRHPVFRPRGVPPFIEQAGNQYFQRGIRKGGQAAREHLLRLVEDAANSVKSHPVENK